MKDQHYYLYQFDSTGTLSMARFTASAYGNLDCDSVFSTFQRLGEGDRTTTRQECSLRGSAAFYMENETELSARRRGSGVASAAQRLVRHSSGRWMT